MGNSRSKGSTGSSSAESSSVGQGLARDDESKESEEEMRFALAKEHIRNGNTAFKLSNFSRASKYYTDAIKSIMPQRFLNELERHTSDLSLHTGNMDTLLAYIDEEIENTERVIKAMKEVMVDFPVDGGLKFVMTTIDTAKQYKKSHRSSESTSGSMNATSGGIKSTTSGSSNRPMGTGYGPRSASHGTLGSSSSTSGEKEGAEVGVVGDASGWQRGSRSSSGDLLTSIHDVERALHCSVSDMYTKQNLLSDCVNNLGASAFVHNDLKSSLLMYHKALTLRRLVEGANSLGSAECLQNMATSLEALSELKAAEKRLQEALMIERGLHMNETSIESTSLLNNLGVLYSHMKRFEEAEEILTSVVDQRRNAIGDGHRLTTNAMKNLKVVQQHRSLHRGGWVEGGADRHGPSYAPYAPGSAPLRQSQAKGGESSMESFQLAHGRLPSGDSVSTSGVSTDPGTSTSEPAAGSSTGEREGGKKDGSSKRGGGEGGESEREEGQAASLPRPPSPVPRVRTRLELTLVDPSTLPSDSTSTSVEGAHPGAVRQLVQKFESLGTSDSNDGNDSASTGLPIDALGPPLAVDPGPPIKNHRKRYAAAISSGGTDEGVPGGAHQAANVQGMNAAGCTVLPPSRSHSQVPTALPAAYGGEGEAVGYDGSSSSSSVGTGGGSVCNEDSSDDLAK